MNKKKFVSMIRTALLKNSKLCSKLGLEADEVRRGCLELTLDGKRSVEARRLYEGEGLVSAAPAATSTQQFELPIDYSVKRVSPDSDADDGEYKLYEVYFAGTLVGLVYEYSKEACRYDNSIDNTSSGVLLQTFAQALSQLVAEVDGKFCESVGDEVDKALQVLGKGLPPGWKLKPKIKIRNKCAFRYVIIRRGHELGELTVEFDTRSSGVFTTGHYRTECTAVHDSAQEAIESFIAFHEESIKKH